MKFVKETPFKGVSFFLSANRLSVQLVLLSLAAVFQVAGSVFILSRPELSRAEMLSLLAKVGGWLVALSIYWLFLGYAVNPWGVIVALIFAIAARKAYSFRREIRETEARVIFQQVFRRKSG